MPTAVSLSASNRRVTGTTGASRAAKSAREGRVSPSRTLHLQLPVEAAALAGVAGRALLVDQQQQGVAVAVQPDVAAPLPGTGGLSLPPVLLAAARPVGGPAGAEGAVQRLVVHPGDHQHLAGVVLLDDGGDEPRGIAAQQRGDRRVQLGVGGGSGHVPIVPSGPVPAVSPRPRSPRPRSPRARTPRARPPRPAGRCGRRSRPGRRAGSSAPPPPTPAPRTPPAAPC